jgi:hypothetical protein
MKEAASARFPPQAGILSENNWTTTPTFLREEVATSPLSDVPVRRSRVSDWATHKDSVSLALPTARIPVLSTIVSHCYPEYSSPGKCKQAPFPLYAALL